MSLDKMDNTCQTVTITFKLDPEMGYCWSIDNNQIVDVVRFAGGYESMLEVFDDSMFMETIVSYLGTSCIPKNVLESAKKRDLNNRIKLTKSDIKVIKKHFVGIPFTVQKK